MPSGPIHRVTEERRQFVREKSRFNMQANLAALMGISVDTLQRYYSEEYAQGKAVAISEIGEDLLARARKGYTAEAIFFLKTQGGWHQKVELSGKDGGPIQTIDLSAALAGKSEDELRILEQFLVALASQGGVSIPANDPLQLESGSSGEDAA